MMKSDRAVWAAFVVMVCVSMMTGPVWAWDGERCADAVGARPERDGPFSKAAVRWRQDDFAALELPVYAVLDGERLEVFELEHGRPLTTRDLDGVFVTTRHGRGYAWGFEVHSVPHNTHGPVVLPAPEKHFSKMLAESHLDWRILPAFRELFAKWGVGEHLVEAWEEALKTSWFESHIGLFYVESASWNEDARWGRRNRQRRVQVGKVPVITPEFDTEIRNLVAASMTFYGQIRPEAVEDAYAQHGRVLMPVLRRWQRQGMEPALRSAVEAWQAQVHRLATKHRGVEW